MAKPMFDTSPFPRISFNVIGVPGSQGSKTRYGKVMVEGSSKAGREKLKNWRQDVAEAAARATEGMAPLDGPLAISIVFRLKRPASWPKTAGDFHMVKPDKDKMIRATLDALTQSGTIVDDARICSITALAIVTTDWTGANIQLMRMK